MRGEGRGGVRLGREVAFFLSPRGVGVEGKGRVEVGLGWGWWVRVRSCSAAKLMSVVFPPAVFFLIFPTRVFLLFFQIFPPAVFSIETSKRCNTSPKKSHIGRSSFFHRFLSFFDLHFRLVFGVCFGRRFEAFLAN